MSLCIVAICRELRVVNMQRVCREGDIHCCSGGALACTEGNFSRVIPYWQLRMQGPTLQVCETFFSRAIRVR